MAAAIRVVYEALAVGRKFQTAFLRGGVGNTACGVVLHRGDVNVAAQHKCHFLAVGRYSHVGRTAVYKAAYHVVVEVVAGYFNINFHRFGAGTFHIQFTVPAESQGTVVRHTERTHRVLGKFGKLTFGVAGEVVLPHVEGSVFFRHIIVRVAFAPQRVHVVAVEVGQFGEFIAVLEPYVRGSRRALVFAQRVFISFLVAVQHTACRVDRCRSHGQRNIHTRTRIFFVDIHHIYLTLEGALGCVYRRLQA